MVEGCNTMTDFGIVPKAKATEQVNDYARNDRSYAGIQGDW